MSAVPSLEPRLEALAQDVTIKLLNATDERKDFVAAIAANESYKELIQHFKLQGEPQAKMQIRKTLQNLGVPDGMPEVAWRQVLQRALDLLDELEFGTKQLIAKPADLAFKAPDFSSIKLFVDALALSFISQQESPAVSTMDAAERLDCMIETLGSALAEARELRKKLP